VTLDVAEKYADIRRLTRTHPLFRVGIARGLDADDLLQAVVLGILTRQQGRSRYDSARASFSRYVHLVAGSVLANVLESQRVRAKREVLGTEADAATGASGEAIEDEVEVSLRAFAWLVAEGHEPRLVLLLVEGGSLAMVRRRRGGHEAEAIALGARMVLSDRESM
jgi:DNA-directed RNA polymerase specialized sigma24 family protein